VRRTGATFRGAGTGRIYAFTAGEPVQAVEREDAHAMLRSGLFQLVR
jgi:hypothetical protein